MNAPDRLPDLDDGVYYDLPAEHYHVLPRLSSHGAKAILKSPLHYKAGGAQKPPSVQQKVGTAIHYGVLQPALFASQVVRAIDCNKRTNAGRAEWDAFCAAHATGVILEPEDYDRAQRCIDAVLAHRAAAELVTGGDVLTELSLTWTDGRYKMPCKARLDVWKHGGITDLKSCADASPNGFSRAIGAFQYHLSAATYYSACEHALDRTPEFFAFVCVETEPPHAVAVYALDRPSILAGMNLWDQALERYKQCRESGEWPGYPEQITTINAPRWALRDFY